MSDHPCSLSIITPTRNGLRFLEECVRHVAREGGDSVEHLVVDGASTDGSVELLARLEGEVPGLRWISEPDSGQSQAMNRGLALARGALVGFLNADDYYESGALHRAKQLPREGPLSLFAGNCTHVDLSGKRLHTFKPARFSWMRMMVHGDPIGFPINPSSYFYHRSIHDRVGLYDESEHYMMDLDFLLRAARVARYEYRDEDWGVMRWMAGTKSFEDLASGQAKGRLAACLRKELGRQPVWLKAWVKLMRLRVRIAGA